MSQTASKREAQQIEWSKAIARRLGVSDVDPMALAEIISVVGMAYNRGRKEGEAVGHENGYRDGQHDLKRIAGLKERYAFNGICQHCGEELPEVGSVHKCPDDNRLCYAETD